MLTESFCVWAPDESPWSPWVKPVLFAHMGSAISQLVIAETAGDVSWAPSPGERAALVLDLPGAEGTLTGLALAARGYRPVPLYNAVPVPYGQRMLDLATGSAVTAVNVFPIVSALRRGAEELAHLKLSADAPPAFLLDANRRGDGRKMKVGEFDNRSVSFTTDFPSANFLASQKIGRVILVQKDRQAPQTDLAHSLRRWQDAGLILERKRLDMPGAPARFEVARPSWYGAMFQRVLAGFGLRRSPKGGFGAWVPEPSSGG